MTIIIEERALDWIERWTRHALPLGKHDGAGNLLLEYEADDHVAADMAAEITTDRSLADGVASALIVLIGNNPDAWEQV